MTANDIHQQLLKLGTKEKVMSSQWFFKTAPGQYGEGDVFVGVTVPELRKLCREHQGIAETGVRRLLKSPIHEERLLALLILVRRFSKADETPRKRIYELYLKNSRFVNNWDLVDASAEHIVGPFLAGKSKQPLYRLAKSKSLWERRIAIMATFHFVKQTDFSETLKIAKILLFDREDLIHKAVGWMLREIGKRNKATEEGFLNEHYKKMPRTMLRYAIEKFPEPERRAYLAGSI